MSEQTQTYDRLVAAKERRDDIISGTNIVRARANREFAREVLEETERLGISLSEAANRLKMSRQWLYQLVDRAREDQET